MCLSFCSQGGSAFPQCHGQPPHPPSPRLGIHSSSPSEGKPPSRHVHPPFRRQTPLRPDTVNWRAVRILLECILIIRENRNFDAALIENWCGVCNHIHNSAYYIKPLDVVCGIFVWYFRMMWDSYLRIKRIIWSRGTIGNLAPRSVRSKRYIRRNVCVCNVCVHSCLPKGFFILR